MDPCTLIDSHRLPEPGALAGDDLAVFVGGLRWFGVHWGLHRVPEGLRDGGFAGRIIYWTWHRPVAAVFCSPVYLNRERMEAEAALLADFLAGWRRDNPGRRLHLLGCSAGGYLALRALELLPEGVMVDSAAFLSAAFGRRHDMTAALAHVRGPALNSSSRLDWLILGVATWLTGTPDGIHEAAAGMAGCADATGRVTELRWRPGMILDGRWGGHSTCTPRRFVARYVAPLLTGGGGAQT